MTRHRPFIVRPDWQVPLVREITREHLQNRFAEILSQARDHKNDLVLTYNPLQKIWPIRLGVVRDDIAAEIVNPQEVIDFTDSYYLAADGLDFQPFAFPIQFNIEDAYKSLQTFQTSERYDLAEPQLQIMFGNEAIAEWFQYNEQTGLLWANLEQYQQMAEILGFTPLPVKLKWHITRE